MQFETTIQSGGGNTTGIHLTDAQVEELGKGKRPPVRVTINGYSYRTTVGVMGGIAMVSVSAEVRANAGVAAGDAVTVTLALDDQPRKVEVPADLATALEAEPAARAFFDGLSYSNKRRLVLAIEGAKQAETRARRITKTVEGLREGRA